MDFGVFILAQQRGYHQAPETVIRNAIEQTVAAEAAGFSSAWYAEHHFNNYSLSPSPLMMVSHAAALTKKIRLGSAVCILPLYQPVRLLAEIGMADVFSNGRLELGVGSGYQKFEFDRFGVKIEESQEIFNETLDVLQKAFAEKVFSYEGKHIQIPPTSIAVRPLQKPLPPLWITSGNPQTLSRAVREGHNMFVTALLNGMDAIKTLRGKLEDVAASEGKQIDDLGFGFLRCAFASDNQAEIDSYLDNARFQRRISESLKYRRAESDDGYMVKEVPGQNDPTFEQLRANLPVGSVNQVIDRMLEEISVLKPKLIAIQTQLGDLDQKMMLKQIELWGEKIIPAIQRELGPGKTSSAQAA
ncbi:LLM class flavin-dependent oxidoreductase [Aquamicrobium sp. LC103]|uniref:LLM class flavin-dependent oxidoreductase n=1 Tax=Aquamicrobium sp. LC103 TaxID=1120658 RepID=UPI00063E940F|nr:LLM class flavin-dependent oxidoreductase [Aquamicrobium sp. LC103]TKT69639.1 LLM class flavin-dependent oxidoreductase [Aquamicrobium sp. LC103]